MLQQCLRWGWIDDAQAMAGGAFAEDGIERGPGSSVAGQGSRQPGGYSEAGIAAYRFSQAQAVLGCLAGFAAAVCLEDHDPRDAAAAIGKRRDDGKALLRHALDVLVAFYRLRP